MPSTATLILTSLNSYCCTMHFDISTSALIDHSLWIFGGIAMVRSGLYESRYPSHRFEGLTWVTSVPTRVTLGKLANFLRMWSDIPDTSVIVGNKWADWKKRCRCDSLAELFLEAQALVAQISQVQLLVDELGVRSCNVLGFVASLVRARAWTMEQVENFRAPIS